MNDGAISVSLMNPDPLNSRAGYEAEGTLTCIMATELSCFLAPERRLSTRITRTTRTNPPAAAPAAIPVISELDVEDAESDVGADCRSKAKVSLMKVTKKSTPVRC